MKKIILLFSTSLFIGSSFAQSILLVPNKMTSMQSTTTDNIVLQGTNPPNIVGIRHNGTLAVPTATTNGNFLLSLDGKGHNSSAITSTRGLIRYVATENWTPTANGTKIEFHNTANGSNLLTQRMIINQDGKVGIGTPTPTAKLHIEHSGTDSDPHLRIHTTGSFSRINWSTNTNSNVWTAQSNLESATAATNYWRLEYNASSKFYIAGDGNVGIGTDGPSQKLNIANGSILLESGTTDKALIEPSGVGSGGQITLSASNGIKSLYIRASDAVNKAGEILFYNPSTNLKTMELDGDWAGTGKSRIVVDELQITGGADLAEYFKVNSLVKIEAGTILSVVADGSASLTVSDKAYDSKVVGIISGANGISTGLMLHQKGNEKTDGDYPVAITGRVYVKADASKDAIKVGDLLTTSAKAGFAMKVKNHRKAQGAIIGKALTGLENGTGMVLVLLGVK